MGRLIKQFLIISLSGLVIAACGRLVTPTITPTVEASPTETAFPSPIVVTPTQEASPTTTTESYGIPQEIMSQLPDGWSVAEDDFGTRIVSQENTILYIKDGETWREPVSLEYPANFEPLWSERSTGISAGFEVPITIGLMDGVVNNEQYPIKELHMTEGGAEMVTDLFLHASWGRYRDLMDHPEVTYEEYLELLKEGKGNLEILVLDEDGTAKTKLVDPREGFSLILTDQENMPLAINNNQWGVSLNVDEKGRFLLALNTYRFLYEGGDDDVINSKFGYSVFAYEQFRAMALVLEIPNKCMQTSDVYRVCGFLDSPTDFNEWTKPFIDWGPEFAKGITDDPLFTTK